MEIKLLSDHIDGSVQNFSNPIVNALELLQSCTKPLILPPQGNSYIGEDASSYLTIVA